MAFGGLAISTLLSGGEQGVYGTAIGTVINSGGLEEVFSGGTTGDTTISGGTLELQSGAVVSGSIIFEGSRGTLTIDGTSLPSNEIDGFTAGDLIEFNGVSFTSAAVPVWNWEIRPKSQSVVKPMV